MAVGATFAVKALGVSSVDEFRDVMRGFGDPVAQSLQDALVPLKARIQVRDQNMLNTSGGFNNVPAVSICTADWFG